MGIGRPSATASVGSLNGDIVTATKADMTLYVRSTGNDGNDGLTEGTALLTIQEAIDRIPKFVKHDVTVDIGEGNFDGFMVTGFTIENPATFDIHGTLGNPALTTGTVSGTATGGSTSQLVDTTQNWTGNDLRGYLLKVGSEYRIIRNNTVDTINVVGDFSASTSGKAYEILEQKTIITTAPTEYPNGRIYVAAINSWRRDYFILSDMQTTPTYFALVYTSVTEGTIKRLRVNGTSGQSGSVFGVNYCGRVDVEDSYTNGNSAGWGFNLISDQYLTLTRLYDFGSKYGIVVQGTQIVVYTDLVSDYAVTIGIVLLMDGEIVGQGDLQISNSSGTGLSIQQCLSVGIPAVTVDTCSNNCIVLGASNLINFDSVDIKNAGENGIQIECGSLSVDIDSGIIDNNGGYGILLDSNATGNRSALSFLNAAGTITIQNNALGGIIAKNHSVVALTAATGSNTAGYGLELQTGSYATITSATAITGASGDATIDGGITVLSWATDFPNDGDTVANIGNNCRIERKD